MKTQTPKVPKPKTYIAKSNDYINSPKKLTAAQRNVLNVILTKVRMNIDIEYVDFGLHEISDLMGITVTNFTQFREVFRTMKEIEVVDMVSEGLRLDNLIGATTFLNNNMGIRFELTDLAKSHFIKLKDVAYTRQLFSSSLFQSVYVHEIWDLICSVKNQRVKSITLSVDDLRSRLMLEPGKYSVFYDFRKRVLEAAKEQINKKTGIKMDYIPIKIGRNIVSIKFVILSMNELEQHQPEAEPEPVIESTVNSRDEYDKMVGLMKGELKFVSDENIQTLANKYPAVHFFKQLYQIRIKRGLNTEIKNPEKYLMADYEKTKK